MRDDPAAGRQAGAGSRPEAAPARIEIRNLRKVFSRRSGAEVAAIDDVSFSVAEGEFVVLLGPSGCGKSTLLRCIAGLDRPTDGEIVLGNQTVSSPQRNIHVQPERRNLSMMFQTYAIWPHMTVAQNVAYPLRVRKHPQDRIREAVDDILGTVGLTGLGGEYPGQLSGGQQQRVGLARSLVVSPEVVLFDEPLSNVDAKVRRLLRRELVAMQRRFGFSGLYVTHDQDEALHIADRVILMRNGRIAQSGTPQQVFEEPNSKYSASFFGDINEIEGRVASLATDVATGRQIATVATPLGPAMRAGVKAPVAVGDAVTVVVRPHQMVIEPALQKPSQGPNAMAGQVVRQTTSGVYVEYLVAVQDTLLSVWRSKADPQITVGAPVRVSFDPDDAHAFDAAEAD